MAGSIKERLDELEEYGVPSDVIDALRQEVDSSKLRQKVGELEARWKDEGEPAIAKVQEFETRPKRIEALRKAGIDYEDLKPYARDYLDRNIPADKLEDSDYIAEVISQGGFEASLEVEQGEQTGAEQMAAHVNSRLQSGPRTNITPTDYASWDFEKRREFLRSNPDKAEALAKGESVPA